VTGIGRVTNLAHLAVARNVYPNLELLGDYVPNGTAHRLIKIFLVQRFAAILRRQHVDHDLWPWHAAGMRSQHPIFAEPHARARGATDFEGQSRWEAVSHFDVPRVFSVVVRQLGDGATA
jgi:hypothetical protein